MNRLTVTQLADRLRTEADAYLYMEELRWPNGPVCPHCGHDDATFLNPANGVSRKTRTGAMSERRVWKLDRDAGLFPRCARDRELAPDLLCWRSVEFVVHLQLGEELPRRGVLVGQDGLGVGPEGS